ncbi:MAG: hypothetical protein JNK67_25685 [Alphaproteobacteria bacterium]|nr:hypothetical protein [Alphaproteobacteria bacterium]
MSRHSYPVNALVGDYARATFGLVLTAGPASLVPAQSYALWALVPLAALFAVFALRTAARHRTVVEMSPQGLSLSTWRQASLEWSALRSLRVDYYSTRGDRSGGWMQLTVKGDGTSIRVDSAIDEFVAIARAAADAARRNGVAVSEATRVNLGHLGIPFDD